MATGGHKAGNALEETRGNAENQLLDKICEVIVHCECSSCLEEDTDCINHHSFVKTGLHLALQIL